MLKKTAASFRQDLNNLITSILERELLQPIVVRALEDHCYNMIAGNRWYEECRRLSWKKIITCHIVDLNVKETFKLSLIGNIQTETLNPINEEGLLEYVSVCI